LSTVPALTTYGHSWVQGAGATSPQRRLAQRAARGLGLRLDNRGVGGSLSTQTAELVARGVPPASAAYLVMTGLNDVRLHGDSARAMGELRDSLDRILDALRAASPAAPIAVVEQPHLLDYTLHPPHDRGSDALVDRGNSVLREVAGRHPGAVVVSVHRWDRLRMLADDTAHPNDDGHAEVARAVVPALHAVLAARS